MSKREKINWAVSIAAFILLGFVFFFWRVNDAGATQCNANNPRNCPTPRVICDNGQHTGNPHCSPSPTPRPTRTPRATPTATPSPSSEPTATPTMSPTPMASPTATPSATPVKTPDPKDPPEKSDPCFYIPCSTPTPVAPLLAPTGSGKESAYLLLIGLGAIAFSFGLRKLIK